MTQSKPGRRGPKQVNKDGSTGFIGGEHHHVHIYGGGYPAGAATTASREATSGGVHLGPAITELDPTALGVHLPITVDDEVGLTPYLARPHDQQIQHHLTQAKAAERPTFIIVIGTSCTGKTRALYEGVRSVLPTWPVATPASDSALAALVRNGIPANTVVWLDELQDLIPATTAGIFASTAITELLRADNLGPIVFAATVWPTNYEVMQARPEAGVAATGAGAIRDLLTNTTLVTVPDAFNDKDLPDQRTIHDRRLRAAIDTANQTDHPQHGRKIIQVLAGGAQLVQRLHPPGDRHTVGQFSAAARAVLLAAGDLRRVGLPNPIPGWAIEDAAPDYLHPPDPRPPAHWLPAAIEGATRAAQHDDPITDTHTHDNYQDGVPALSPHWTITSEGRRVEAFDLHDYLLQDHLARYRYSPTKNSLWETLTAFHHRPDIALKLGSEARARGLLTPAITLTRQAVNPLARSSSSARPGFPHHEAGTHTATPQEAEAEVALVRVLGLRGEPDDMSELTALSKHSPAAHDELKRRSSQTDAAREPKEQRPLQERLSRLLPSVGMVHGAELRALFDDFSPPTIAAIRRAAAGTPMEVIVAQLLAELGVEGGLIDLQRIADGQDRQAQYARMASLDLFADRRDLDGLREMAKSEGEIGLFAQRKLIRLLCTRGTPSDIAEVEQMVHGGVGCEELLALHRARLSTRRVRELNVNAQPVFSPARQSV